MPPLIVWANPKKGAKRIRSERKMSGRVYEVGYRHAADGDDYKHDFGPGVEMWAGKADGGRDVVSMVGARGQKLYDEFSDHGKKKLYLVNPSERGRPMANGRKPTRKQLAARKKFVAMVRAKSKAAKKSTRTTSAGGSPMARRKRASAPAGKRRRRSRHAAGYAMNPRGHRKHRKSRKYRRNPGGRDVMRQVKAMAIDTGLILGGMAAGRFVGNLIPVGSATDPVMNALKAISLGIASEMFLPKMIGGNAAHMLAVGMLVKPGEALINAYIPGASQFMGAYPSKMGAVFPNPRLRNNLQPAGNRRMLRSGSALEAYAMGAYAQAGNQ